MKPKAFKNMVEISKYDKKVWENYVSNFEKHVLLQQNKALINANKNNHKFSLRKNETLSNNKNLIKKKLQPNMILDLHGHTLYSSKLLLYKFIPNCYEKNIRDILIITGKGQNNKGALKEEVPKWLTDKYFSKFLVNFNRAPKHFGGEGALLARIKNKFKKI